MRVLDDAPKRSKSTLTMHGFRFWCMSGKLTLGVGVLWLGNHAGLWD